MFCCWFEAAGSATEICALHKWIIICIVIACCAYVCCYLCVLVLNTNTFTQPQRTVLDWWWNKSAQRKNCMISAQLASHVDVDVNVWNTRFCWPAPAPLRPSNATCMDAFRDATVVVDVCRIICARATTTHGKRRPFQSLTLTLCVVSVTIVLINV